MNLIFDKLKIAYDLQTDVELAGKLGLKPNTLSMHRKRGTLDINAILTTCTGIDYNWLFDPGKKLIDLGKSESLRAADQPAFYTENDFVSELLLLRKRIRTQQHEIIELQKRLASRSK